jgi:hypothetical protein
MPKNGIVADGHRRMEAGQGKPPRNWFQRLIALLTGLDKPDKRVF